ncbi:hypothetical protein EVAR_8382_1 [Eumeta japonica]|uniref:Uncharacterized protein n=1 Tax=Eumeta variegata TaxID=151549 RepID=A0A4C1VE81_EUMVA|nr:hypothetical protein EVAR_8382_1 [Eumeta japonica]
MVIAAYGHSQLLKSSWCVAGILWRNKISNGGKSGLLERGVGCWREDVGCTSMSSSISCPPSGSSAEYTESCNFVILSMLSPFNGAIQQHSIKQIPRSVRLKFHRPPDRRNAEHFEVFGISRLSASRRGPATCTVSVATRLKASHDGVLIPTFIYGSESWVWQKKNESRINAVEMQSLRSTCAVSQKDRCRNSGVGERRSLKEDVVTRVEQGMFDHLERMNENRLTK